MKKDFKLAVQCYFVYFNVTSEAIASQFLHASSIKQQTSDGLEVDLTLIVCLWLYRHDWCIHMNSYDKDAPCDVCRH